MTVAQPVSTPAIPTLPAFGPISMVASADSILEKVDPAGLLFSRAGAVATLPAPIAIDDDDAVVEEDDENYDDDLDRDTFGDDDDVEDGFNDGLDEDDELDEFDDIDEDDFDDGFDDDFEEEVDDDYEIEIDDEISDEFGLSTGPPKEDDDDDMGDFEDFDNLHR